LNVATLAPHDVSYMFGTNSPHERSRNAFGCSGPPHLLGFEGSASLGRPVASSTQPPWLATRIHERGVRRLFGPTSSFAGC
jgi:hypothetical protein